MRNRKWSGGDKSDLQPCGFLQCGFPQCGSPQFGSQQCGSLHCGSLLQQCGSPLLYWFRVVGTNPHMVAPRDSA